MNTEREKYNVLKDLLGTPLNSRNPIDRNNNVTFPCLFCGHKRPKLTINLETEVYNCWVCEVRGVGIKYMLDKLKIKIPSAYDVIFKSKKDRKDIDNLFGDKSVVEKKETKVTIPKGYNPLYINKNKLWYVPAVNYLTERGLVQEDYLKYDIHYSVADQRVLFPSYDAAMNLNYYLSRAINDSEFRYRNANVSKDKIIFNEHLVDWESDIYIVEGVFDAIASGKNAIPILGSYISNDSYLMRRLLQHKHKVIFALDPDAKDKMFKFMKKLNSYGVNISYVKWGKDSRDISEMGLVDFNNKSLSGYCFEDEVLHKLGGF
jgi:DNA primase